MNKIVLFSSILTLTFLLSFSLDSAFAHPHSGQVLINDHTHESQTETIPLNGNIALEKTSLFFHTPEDNALPWAFVEGKIANHVEGYPVIIQIFQENDAVHFAQTDVNSDGSYEYRFRVLSSDNGVTSKIFDGDYSVKIFKVVHQYRDNLA
ncbi:hypothetical protein [Nitrosopumilus sp.]|uniref:hypothetical protein n=1 Tax=Nitrosopumilus sp. TaxID=2024843 RepID=UPI00247E388C|nr:hypothetical protein [Nitrosopumilus sp.]MCV0430450.1 hypothetical protein [Nitrosopumilus sp.]